VLRHLERAAVDADVLPDHEHALVAAHLGAEPVGDRLEIREFGHRYLWCWFLRSSGIAYTPSSSVDGSGCGDASARCRESLSSFFTCTVISFSSSSVMSTFCCSQAR